MCGEEIAMGPGKCELLEAIDETGSITKAAARMEMSYMRAWSLIRVMNRCFRQPLVRSERGGQRGGGAALTADGRAAIRLYRAMSNQSIDAARSGWDDLRPLLLGGEGKVSVALSTASEDDDLVTGSIRNEAPGIIKEIVSDKVLTEVVLDTAVGEIASVITTRSAKELKLKVGDKAVALIKATNVSLRRAGKQAK